MLSLPLVGTYLSFFVSAVNSPAQTSSVASMPVHILVVPGLILALLTAHLIDGLVPEAHPVPRAGPHQRQRGRIPGAPIYMAGQAAFFVVFGVITLIQVW